MLHALASTTTLHTAHARKHIMYKSCTLWFSAARGRITFTRAYTHKQSTNQPRLPLILFLLDFSMLKTKKKMPLFIGYLRAPIC